MGDLHQKSRVYQLDFEEILVKEGLVPHQTTSTLGIYVDSMPLKDEDRSKAIDDLLTLFPEGTLTREGENALVLNCSSKQLKRDWLKRIQTIVSQMDEDNVAYRSGLSATLIKCLQNPLETEYRFCIQDAPFCWTPSPSSEFLRALMNMDKGDRIYVGTILEY